MRYTWVAMAVVLLAGPGLAQEKMKAPEGPPPLVVPLRAGPDADTLQVGQPVMFEVTEKVMRLVAVEREVLENGKVLKKVEFVPETTVVQMTRMRFEFRQHSFRELEVYDLKGKRQSREDVRKALGGKTIAVLLVQRQIRDKPGVLPAIDPFYLEIYREGTLIIVPPDQPIPLPPKMPEKLLPK